MISVVYHIESSLYRTFLLYYYNYTGCASCFEKKTRGFTLYKLKWFLNGIKYFVSNLAYTVKIYVYIWLKLKVLNYFTKNEISITLNKIFQQIKTFSHNWIVFCKIKAKKF